MNMNVCGFGDKLANLPIQHVALNDKKLRFTQAKNVCVDRFDSKEEQLQLSESFLATQERSPKAKKIPCPYQKREIRAIQRLQSKRSKTAIAPHGPIDELNHKIPLFLDLLKTDAASPLSPFPSDLARYLLTYLANQYYLSVKNMYLQGKIPSSQIDNILRSTHLDSEIMQKSLETGFLPDSTLGLLLIGEFFRNHLLKSPLTSHEGLFLNLITDCCKTLMMIKLVLKYVPDPLKHNAKQCVQEILKQQVLLLPDQEKILIPGGWINLPQENIEGHFMLYMLERRNSSEFVKIRINTHEPLDLRSETDRLPIMIEEEIISINQLEMFLSDIMDLLFPASLTMLSKENASERYLLQIGRDYSDKISAFSSGLDIDMQRYSANCCFMSCFMLYQYLYLHKGYFWENSADISESIKSDAFEFRENYQNFLNKELGLSIS